MGSLRLAHIPNGGGSQTPNRIIVHAMAQYVKYKERYLYAPAFLNEVGLSAHILVDPSGEVIQCRYDKEIAYHARGFNTNSLGIEFLVEGRHDYESFLEAIKTDYITDKQYQSGVEVVMEWLSQHNILNVDRHSDIDPTRKIDPYSLDWTKFKHDIGWNK